MPSGQAHKPETVARVRRLVQATSLPMTAVAAETEVPAATIRSWVRRHGWARPAAARPANAPARLAAARRLHAGGGSTGDLATLLGCSEKWLRRSMGIGRAAADPRTAPDGLPPPAPAEADMEALAARLRDPGLSRSELIRIVERATAVAAAAALTGRDPRADRTALALARMAGIVKGLPETADGPAADEDWDETTESGAARLPETGRLIEAIARRFEAFCGARDPAAVPEDTVPARA